MSNRARTPINEFTTANTLVDDLISPNFRVRELVRSEIALRHGIDNWFRTDKQLQSAIFLAREVLQPIRDVHGPFTPNSVYRGQALERALKKKPKTWVSRSQHTLGQAADIEVPAITNYMLAQWIAASSLSFDQLILEMHTPGIESSGWVHVSIKQSNNNRHEILTFDGEFYSGLRRYVPSSSNAHFLNLPRCNSST